MAKKFKPKTLPPVLRKNIEEFLDSVSETLSCNGCNDWTFSGKEKAAAKKFLGRKISCSDYEALHIIQVALGFEDEGDEEDEEDFDEDDE